MPLICIFGQVCRVRPLLDAIGAQEALESHNGQLQSPMKSRPQEALHERGRLVLADRRNRAEKALRTALDSTPDCPRNEHLVWEEFRRGTPALREAIRAILTDLPGRAMPALGAAPLAPDPAHK